MIALPFTGYEPHPSGTGYNFQRPGAPPVFAYGQQADQLKALIDASAPPDQRLAMGGPAAAPPGPPGPPPTATDAGGMSVPPPENMSTAPMSVSNPSPPETMSRVGAEAPSDAIPPPPSDGNAPVMDIGAAPGGAPATRPVPEYMGPDPYKVVGGRNPAREAALAVPVPTTQQVTTEGGIANPELRDMAIQAYKARMGAEGAYAEFQQQAALQQAEQQKAAAAEAARQRQEAEDQLERAAAQKAVLRQEFDKRLGIAQDVADKAGKAEVDQGRVFRGKPGALIGSMLFAVLGGIGAGMTRTNQNIALQQIQKTIDNDIEEQRRQIQQGQIKANNDLARIREQYGLDTDDAAQVMKLAYAKQVDAQAQHKAAQIGTQQALAQYAAIQPTLAKTQADIIADMNATLLGKVKMVQDAKLVVPSAGGVRPKTELELLRETAEAEGYRGKIAEGRARAANGGVLPKPSDAAKPGEIIPGLARAETAIETGLAALPELSKLSKDAGWTGQVTGRITGAGADTELTTAAQHLAYNVAAAEVNGQVPDRERVAELTHLLSSPNPVTRERNILMARDILLKKKQASENVSAKTAKVGNISVGTGGGEE